MESTLMHKCGGRVILVLPQTAYFSLSPRITTVGVNLSLGEIGKLDGNSISSINGDSSLVPMWLCEKCAAEIKEANAEDVMVRCSRCNERTSIDVMVTTRGYAAICPDCFKKEKKLSSTAKEKKDVMASTPSDLDGGTRMTGYRTDNSSGTTVTSIFDNSLSAKYIGRKSDTYTPKTYVSIMFNEIKLRSRR